MSGAFVPSYVGAWDGKTLTPAKFATGDRVRVTTGGCGTVVRTFQMAINTVDLTMDDGTAKTFSESVLVAEDTDVT